MHIQLLPVLENGEETTLVGGQAVMEGVMMRSPHSYCVAVRKPSGEIVTEESPLPRLSDRYPISSCRSCAGSALSATPCGSACARSSSPPIAPWKTSPASRRRKRCLSRRHGSSDRLLARLHDRLYKLCRSFSATELGRHFHSISSRFAVNMTDGFLRIAISLASCICSRASATCAASSNTTARSTKSSSISNPQPVTVENAQRFVTWHPRCGTSFLVVVLIIAMLCYAFLPIDNFWAKLAARIALLPLIVGVSYEVIRFAAKRRTASLSLTQPGLWLQRVSTKPPSDAQNRSGHPRPRPSHGARSRARRPASYRLRITPCNIEPA